MRSTWAIGLIAIVAVAMMGCMVDNEDDENNDNPGQADNGSGNTGGGGPGGTGGAAQGGQQERSDGTVGSSCGTCQQGLECDTSAPGGYCTKLCQAQQECGGNAFCYEVQSGTGVCLNACQTDQNCRPGYSCQGDQGYTVCFPGTPGSNGGSGGSGGGNTAGPTCGLDLFAGWWAPECSSTSCEQYQFQANGTFQYEWWSYVSGTMYDSGTWSISCPQISARFSDGKVQSFVIQGSALYRDGSTRLAHCSDRCY